MFQPQHGVMKWIFLFGALVAGGLFFALLQITPQKLRRPLILTITFLGGLLFAAEFFLPIHKMPTPEDPTAEGNFLTPFIAPFGAISPVIQAFAIGLGVVNLIQIHGNRLRRRAPGSVNSLAFFISMFAMLSVNLLQKAHPNAINKNLNKLLFDGGLNTLDATMFSIIAFYIVSAAYRAFRVRSVEATLLLATAVIVMLGQTSIGIFLTAWLPPSLHGARVEVARNWILTQANTPALRAIAFGLGIGGLAFALRVWLGLERGSYFDSQG